jgi:hypothetical protein
MRFTQNNSLKIGSVMKKRLLSVHLSIHVLAARRFLPGITLILLACLAPMTAPAISPIVPVTGPDALEGWGEHVVTYGGHLHVVYLSGGAVKYVTSADGQLWSQLVNVSVNTPSPHNPTIGIDGEGNLGIAFSGGTTRATRSLYYTYKPYNQSSWSVPQKIIQGGNSPAMVGFHNEMHVAFNDGISIRYTKFATTAPPLASAGNYQSIWEWSNCDCGAESVGPVIALAPSDPCEKLDPVIRVAFYYEQDWSDCPYRSPTYDSGVQLYGSTSPGNWQQEMADVRQKHVPAHPDCIGATPIYNTVRGLSLTADRRSGVFFLGYSFFWDYNPNISGSGTAVGALVRIPKTGAPQSTGIANTSIDLAAANHSTANRFKLVVGSTYEEDSWPSAGLITAACGPSPGLPLWVKAEAVYYNHFLGYYLGNYFRWGVNLVFLYQDTVGYKLATDGVTINTRAPSQGFCALPTDPADFLYRNCFILGGANVGVSAAQNAMAGTSFILSVSLTNGAPTTLTNWVAAYEVPQGVEVINVTPSQGSWTNDSGTVICSLGNLNAGATANIDLEVRAFAPGLLTNIVQFTTHDTGEDFPVFAEAVTLVLDNTPPAIVAATARCNQPILTVRFDEPMDPTFAADPVNYAIGGGTASIVDATLALDGLSVVLALDNPVSGSNTLVVSNLEDASGNLITPNPKILPIKTCCSTNLCVILTCPPPVTVECVNPAGTPVYFNVPFFDGCDTNVTVICTPPSGSVFPFGTTTVQCNAFDDCGNSNQCSFAVNVVDTTGPLILTPGTILVSSSNHQVFFDVMALDNHDTNVTVVCTPPSGSVFPLGDTTVNCTATDLGSNQSTSSFVVTVLDPPSIVQSPISLTRTQGATVTFSVAALGTEPLLYQWRSNTVDIPGATGCTYTLVNAQPSDAGNFNVQVRNLVGVVNSSNATLTVLSTPPTNYDVFLPVYQVIQAGATAPQATNLANSLNIPVSPLTLNNGLLSFADPTNYLRVPTFTVTNIMVISNLVAQTVNQYPEIPIGVESLDLAGLTNLTVLDTNVALSSIVNALGSAGLSPQFGTPVIEHADFTAIFTNESNTVISNSVALDTAVAYEFYGPSGYPFVGPGAQLQVSYGATGNVTRLYYATRQLTAGPLVRIMSESQASNRVASLFPPNAQIVLQLAYWCPPFSSSPQCPSCPPPPWNPTNIIPWYICRGSVNMTNPSSGAVSPFSLLTQMIPATDDTNFVPSVNLSVSAPGSTQIVASVSVTGGTPPYSYLWAGSDPKATTNTGASMAYIPMVRVAPPPLVILASSTSVTVSWPYPSSGFILESTTSLVPAAWSEVTTPLQTNSGLNSVTIPTARSQFLRLRLANQTVAVTETVGVTVTDANGVSAQASQSVAAQAVLTPNTDGPAIDFGCESPFDPGVGTTESSGWVTGMGYPPGGGGAQRFFRKGNAAWPGDFIEPGKPGTLPANPWINGCADCLNYGVNSATIVLYIGHGRWDALSFTYPTDCGSFQALNSYLFEPTTDPWNVYININQQICSGPLNGYYKVPNFIGSWRNSGPTVNDRLYWLCLESCHVLDKYDPNGNNAGKRWGPAFNGLHILAGFDGEASVGNGFPQEFAYRILGKAQAKPTIPPQTIVQAWLGAAAAQGTGKGAALGPFFFTQIGSTPYLFFDYYDHYWGKGTVGPSLPRGLINGGWYVRNH